MLLSSLHPSLLRNASLTSLDLSDNPLGPGVGVAMSHVLGISDSLRDLDLTRCQVRLDFGSRSVPRERSTLERLRS